VFFGAKKADAAAAAAADDDDDDDGAPDCCPASSTWTAGKRVAGRLVGSWSSGTPGRFECFIGG